MKNLKILSTLALYLLLSSLLLAQNLEIASSENFEIWCQESDAPKCQQDKNLKSNAKKIANELEEIKAWFDSLGFKPPIPSTLVKNKDTKKYEIYIDSTPTLERCHPKPAKEDPNKEKPDKDDSDKINLGKARVEAGACHVYKKNGDTSEIYLPINLSYIMQNPGKLAHEFIHAYQRKPSVQENIWFTEAIATAVEDAWELKKMGRQPRIYPPKYRLYLDRSFEYSNMHNPDISAGYRNWAYLLDIGNKLGSPDQIKYFIKNGGNGSQGLLKARLHNGGFLSYFYDKDWVKTYTFDKYFPDFVARFNNIEPYGDKQLNLSIEHTYYYLYIFQHFYELTGLQETLDENFFIPIFPYAATAALVVIDGELAEKEDHPPIFLASVEIKESEKLDDLTLIMEDSRGDTQNKKSWLLDASTLPLELGFVRVVYAPKTYDPDLTEEEYVSAKINTQISPVTFRPPYCFEVGTTDTFEVKGFDPSQVKNWRLISDNGTVSGLKVTPKKEGKITVSLEITSIITRNERSLLFDNPESTEIPLGTFDVQENCIAPYGPMYRVRIENTGYEEWVEMWTVDMQSSYLEQKRLTGENTDAALYMSPTKNAVYTENKWRQYSISEDKHSNYFLYEAGWAKELSLQEVRKANKKLELVPTPCPVGLGDGSCTTHKSNKVTTTAGRHKIIFDSKGRPVQAVRSLGPIITTQQFEYGNFPMRRPPGW